MYGSIFASYYYESIIISPDITHTHQRVPFVPGTRSIHTHLESDGTKQAFQDLNQKKKTGYSYFTHDLSIGKLSYKRRRL